MDMQILLDALGEDFYERFQKPDIFRKRFQAALDAHVEIHGNEPPHAVTTSKEIQELVKMKVLNSTEEVLATSYAGNLFRTLQYASKYLDKPDQVQENIRKNPRLREYPKYDIVVYLIDHGVQSVDDFHKLQTKEQKPTMATVPLAKQVIQGPVEIYQAINNAIERYEKTIATQAKNIESLTAEVSALSKQVVEYEEKIDVLEQQVTELEKNQSEALNKNTLFEGISSGKFPALQRAIASQQ